MVQALIENLSFIPVKKNLLIKKNNFEQLQFHIYNALFPFVGSTSFKNFILSL